MSTETDRTKWIVDAVESALLDGGWAPKRFLLLATVVGGDGNPMMLGVGSHTISPRDVLTLLSEGFAMVLESSDGE